MSVKAINIISSHNGVNAVLLPPRLIFCVISQCAYHHIINTHSLVNVEFKLTNLFDAKLGRINMNNLVLFPTTVSCNLPFSI